MDGIFSKFGIYDFMGIWGPGAIFVTYFTFTLYQPIHDFLGYCGISNPGFSNTHLLILLYTAVAYTAGATLHELGRILANLFNLFHANDIHSKTADHSQNDSKPEPKNFQIFKRICYEYTVRIKRTIPKGIYKSMSFDKAISYIKYSASATSSRVDTYHAIYALARSVSLTFLLHGIIALLSLYFSYSISPILIISDILFFVLFLIRAYRYHYFWTESVFTQYYYSTHLYKKVTPKRITNKQ